MPLLKDTNATHRQMGRGFQAGQVGKIGVTMELGPAFGLL